MVLLVENIFRNSKSWMNFCFIVLKMRINFSICHYKLLQQCKINFIMQGLPNWIELDFTSKSLDLETSKKKRFALCLLRWRDDL